MKPPQDEGNAEMSNEMESFLQRKYFHMTEAVRRITKIANKRGAQADKFLITYAEGILVQAEKELKIACGSTDQGERDAAKSYFEKVGEEMHFILHTINKVAYEGLHPDSPLSKQLFGRHAPYLIDALKNILADEYFTRTSVRGIPIHVVFE